MPLKSRPILLILLAITALVLVGCTSKRKDETSIPWSRPADWEGRIPGMGG